MSPTPLSRKTKTELLEDYRELQEKYEELKMTAELVHAPQSAELLEKTKAYTADTITASIAGLKTNVNATLNDLADKLVSEAQKFGELREALELSKKNLELNYNIQVAAETLQRLLREYGLKRAELEQEMADKKRDWERAQEEHEYSTKRERTRDEAAYQDLSAKREQEFKERQERLQAQEEELQALRQQAEQFPAKLDKACAQRAEEVARELHVESERQLAIEKKDWEAKKNLLDMQISNLEELAKRQNAEIASLKQETERANKKAQELAVKVIEGASRIAKSEDEKQPAS